MSDAGTTEPADTPVDTRRSFGLSLVQRMRDRITFRRRRSSDGTVRWPVVLVCVVGVFLATAALVWLGYVATREWRSGANQVLERRATEALALVRAAVSADMKGAWTNAIVPFSTELFDEEPPYSLLQVSARAFARFPYPESFILWKRNAQSDGLAYAFNRSDRLPPWDPAGASDDPFPVVLVRQPSALRGLVSAVRKQATPNSAFVVLELPIGAVTYQVIAHVLFTPARPHDLVGFVAFTVNLDWVRSEYFGPLIAEVDKIGGNRGGLSITVADDTGRVVASTGPEGDGTTELRTRFPLLFIDAGLARSMPPPRVAIREWTARVRPVPDNTLFATLQGARRTFILMTLAAGASLLALVLTVKADRASVRLASMKSDFVAGVTHELKTPVALIRLIGDTLANGRYTSTKTVQEYASLLSQEASRLTNSIDNLLTYARYSGSPDPSSIELAAIEPADLIEDALQRLRPTLEHLEFDVTVDVPRELPLVCVDRPAIVQAIDNIVDNTIKYSKARRVLAIVGRRSGRNVQLTFRDRGTGIAREELAHVFDRFYRGRNASVGGSGLGLPIAQRIVNRHGGWIAIRSTVDAGTEVAISLPAALRHEAVV